MHASSLHRSIRIKGNNNRDVLGLELISGPAQKRNVNVLGSQKPPVGKLIIL